MYPLTCIACIRMVVMNCLNISHCLDNSSVQYKTDTHIKKQKFDLIQENLQHVQVHQQSGKILRNEDTLPIG